MTQRRQQPSYLTTSSIPRGGCLVILLLFIATETLGRTTAMDPWFARLKESPSRVEELGGKPVPADILSVVREWHGDRCIAKVTNLGKSPLRLGNVILFDLTPHGIDPNTPIYGEGFQMLSQTTGTFGSPVDLGRYSDRLHYRIPEPDGMRTVYGLMAFDGGAADHVLLGFSSCKRFIGRFSWNADRFRVSVDPEGLELVPGNTWQLEEFIAVAGADRNALFDRLAAAIQGNHRPLRGINVIPTGWCSWYAYYDKVTGLDIQREQAVWQPSCRSSASFRSMTAASRTMAIGWTAIRRLAIFSENPRKPSARKASGRGCGSLRLSRSGILRVPRSMPDWFVKGSGWKPPAVRSRSASAAGRDAPWFVFDGTHPEVQRHLEIRLWHDASTLGSLRISSSTPTTGRDSRRAALRSALPRGWNRIVSAWRPSFARRDRCRHTRMQRPDLAVSGPGQRHAREHGHRPQMGELFQHGPRILLPQLAKWATVDQRSRLRTIGR